MLGILLFFIFLLLGLAISNRLFSNEVLYIRAWAGGIIGLLGLMWGVVPFSFFLRFSTASHMLALLLVVALYLLIRKQFESKGSLKYKSDGTDYVLYTLVVFISAIAVYILNGHILSPGQNGELYGGQSTYGDLSLHLGIITSIAAQGKFPPDYSIFPGTLLSYPFLTDSLSSSLYLFGTPLRWAVLIPSYVMVVLLVAGFFLLSMEILKHKYAAAFSTVIFFFNGGFGFVYFLDGLTKGPSNFTRIFTAWYNTPTNYNEHYIRWSNTICDMIVPQRTTLGGWTVVIFALWLLYRAVEQRENKMFALAGITVGLLPMVHTHSFLAAGIISAVWFFVYFFQVYKSTAIHSGKGDAKSKETDGSDSIVMKWVSFTVLMVLLVIPSLFSKNLLLISIAAFLAISLYLVYYVYQCGDKSVLLGYIKKWLYFGIPALGLALPQLFFWTFRQAAGENFTRLQNGWQANEGDIWPWFWIKNIGIVLILLIPALLAAKRKMLSIYSGALAIFLIANVVLFQPNNYDNNKLLYIWYIFTVIIVSAYVFSLYNRLKGQHGRWTVIAVILVISTLSGVLTIGREIKSNGQYMLFDSNSVEAADYIKANTPADALFISADQHLNPVAALAGRNIFSGSGAYLSFHGINKSDRDSLVESMYKKPESFKTLAEQNNIDYVFYSSYEKDKFKVGPDYFTSNYPAVFHKGDIYIFAVSERARRYKSNR